MYLVSELKIINWHFRCQFIGGEKTQKQNFKPKY